MSPDFPPDVVRFDVPFNNTVLKAYDSNPHSKHDNVILLLHGSGGTAAGSFWAVLPMLAVRHRVVSFDFLDTEAGNESAEHYIAQAQAVIAAIGRPADVVGYSFGAVIAAELAARDPGLIRSLVLAAGWAKTDAQQLLRNDIWQELFDDQHPALPKLSVFMTYGQPFLTSRTPAELKALLEANTNPVSRATKMRFNRSVDILDRLQDVAAPTLVVGCELDQTAPIRHSHLLFGGIDDARLFEIHCGHGVVHERPAELAAAIEDFVFDPTRHPAGTVVPNQHA